MPVDAINVKPIIRELVRTKLCFPDLQLLVDRICVVRLPSLEHDTEKRAGYSLYLTDREFAIQAVIKTRLHQRINRGEIKEGSIVVLKDYELTQSRRLNGDGDVVHLKIADFYPIGEDDRPDRPFAVVGNVGKEQSDEDAPHHASLHKALTLDEKIPPGAVTDFQAEDDLRSTHEDSASAPLSEANENISSESDATTSPLDHQQYLQKRPTQTALDLLEPNPRKRRRKESIDSNDAISDKPPSNSNHQSPEPEPTIQTNRPASHTPPPPPPPPPQPPLIPDALSTLASVTHPHASKNETHNFLALITHVSPHTTKPPRMPRKRDLRIMDTSTEKQVLLNVFTDPVGFQPKVGTIAVFRGLVTHDWDGGNLKAYPWVCEGREWCVVVDDGDGGGSVDGVDEGEVEELRRLRVRVLEVGKTRPTT